jgi:hypothetical protein
MHGDGALLLLLVGPPYLRGGGGTPPRRSGGQRRPAPPPLRQRIRDPQAAVLLQPRGAQEVPRPRGLPAALGAVPGVQQHVGARARRRLKAAEHLLPQGHVAREGHPPRPHTRPAAGTATAARDRSALRLSTDPGPDWAHAPVCLLLWYGRGPHPPSAAPSAWPAASRPR